MNNNTVITKKWTIEIDKKEVFSRCTNESLYQAYVRNADNPKGDAIVVQEDDYGQFSLYIGNAIANLHILLARHMEDLPITSGDIVIFTLDKHDNLCDKVFPILVNHCYQYVVKQVMEQWSHADHGSAIERLEINHCLHYRSQPVRRRIGPLF